MALKSVQENLTSFHIGGESCGFLLERRQDDVGSSRAGTGNKGTSHVALEKSGLLSR